LCLPACRSAAQETTNLAPVAVYDSFTTVSASGGYRENVLYSAVIKENSWFTKTALDTGLMRLSESGSFLLLYFLVEDTRYLDTSAINYEQVMSGSIQYTEPVSEKDEAGFQLNYLYLHQILDASQTEANLYRILVEGHQVEFRSHWQHTFSKRWATKLEAVGLRQIYTETLDNYSEAGGNAELTYSYGTRSEASVAWESAIRHYDTREHYDRQGVPLADTDLRYYQNELSAKWRHNWNKERTLQTTTRLSAMLNRDNGPGYYDYDRLTFHQQVRWEKNDWQFKVNASAGTYRYRVQQVGNSSLNRSYLSIDTRIEKKVSTHWNMYIATQHEWNESNDRLDEYNDCMASIGTTLEF
jgi:hypothetical protein